MAKAYKWSYFISTFSSIQMEAKEIAQSMIKVSPIFLYFLVIERISFLDTGLQAGKIPGTPMNRFPKPRKAVNFIKDCTFGYLQNKHDSIPTILVENA